MIELNEGQRIGVDKGNKWYKKWKNYGYDQLFQIDGAAGTGKSTMIFSLIDDLGINLERVLFVTFVGKAALVLRMKGLTAYTIHSSIYKVVRKKVYDADGKPIMVHGRQLLKPSFTLKSVEEITSLYDLIVVDEAGQVPEKLAKDLLSFNLPIITLGDLNQLPPVMGKRFFLTPVDHTLTEIMRQVADDPILTLATKARVGEDIPFGKYGNNCVVIPSKVLKEEHLASPDIIICGRNTTRDNINSIYRDRVNGYSGIIPEVGEKLICRNNNRVRTTPDDDFCLINGLVGYVEAVHKDTATENKINIDFRPDFLDKDDNYFIDIPIDRNYLTTPVAEKGNIKPITGPESPDLFEYGYAITCHLSQGSEYDKVLIYDEFWGSRSTFYRQWLYTAITRAKKQLIIAK